MLGVLLMLFWPLIAGIFYVIYVVGRMLYGVVSGRREQLEGAEESQKFARGFRKVHLFTFLAIDVVYSLWMFWAFPHHPYQTLWGTTSGPFATAMVEPWPEHWRAAWGLCIFFGPFLLMGILCQFFRLPFQRNPQRVAVILWVVGLLGWFSGAIFSLLQAA
jgi:hypothetical protein